MSLSDCPKCWDTPCTCGHGYSNWDEQRILDQIKMLQNVLNEIRKNDDFEKKNRPFKKS